MPNNMTPAPAEGQQTTIEHVVDKALWSLQIPTPPGEPVPGDSENYQTLHTAKIEALKRYLQTLPDVTNAATMDTNQKALTALTKVRTGLNKERLGMFAAVKALKDRVDTYIGTTAESGLQRRIKALEEPIEARIQAFKNEQERKRQESERLIQERNNARVAHVLASGMVFDGQKYSLGELVLWPVDLNNYGETEWLRFLEARLKPAVDAAAQARADEEAEFQRQEAAKEAEAVRMRELFEKQQDEQRKLDEDRAALDRERAQLRQEKQDARHAEIMALGAEQAPQGYYHVGGDMVQVVSDLAGLSPEEWREAKDAVKRQVSKLKEVPPVSEDPAPDSVVAEEPVTQPDPDPEEAPAQALPPAPDFSSEIELATLVSNALVSAVEAAGDAAGDTSIPEHEELFTHVGNTCRQLYGQAMAAINTLRDR